jgi:Putative addiction module component
LYHLHRKADLITPQAKMGVFDPSVDAFAKIEVRLTPGKISMISLVGDSLSVENRLTAEILSLPSASRAILADKLIESLEFDIDTSIQSAWSSEAKKRWDEVRDGSVRVIPGDDALAQVRNSIDLF